MLGDSRLLATATLLKHLAHLGSALIVSIWCCSGFKKFLSYRDSQVLDDKTGIISQIISTLQYLLLGLLLRSVYELYQALVAICTYFEAELWPTVFLVVECSLLGVSLPILAIHPMIIIMLILLLLPYTYTMMKLYKAYKRLHSLIAADGFHKYNIKAL